MDEEFSPVPGTTPNLEQLGRFILTTDETLIRHRVIRLGGRHWYRFMDYIYSPKPIHLLQPDEVRELCEIRLELPRWAIDIDFHSRVTREVLNLAADFIRRPYKILDFGAGDGRTLPSCLMNFPTSAICGCDMSWRSLHRMESSFPRIQISPTGPLPFQDDTFDLILAIFVLHFTLPPSTLMDLARVSCGYFVGTVYGTRSERLESMLADAGFSVLTYVESRHARGHFIFSATTDAS